MGADVDPTDSQEDSGAGSTERTDPPPDQTLLQQAIVTLPELFSTKGMTASQIAARVQRDQVQLDPVLDLLMRIGVIESVPYREPRRWRMSGKQRRDRVLLASRVIHEGEWTSYGDIAMAVLSTSWGARGIGKIAADPAFANPHRVLNQKGAINPNWTDAQGNGPIYCRERLEREGVRFQDDRAPQSQRVGFQELRERLGQVVLES
jgi:alkylated DNA nucleotide flippase Atl1